MRQQIRFRSCHWVDTILVLSIRGSENTQNRMLAGGHEQNCFRVIVHHRLGLIVRRSHQEIQNGGKGVDLHLERRIGQQPN